MNTIWKRTYARETNRFCISSTSMFWKENGEAGWQRVDIRKPSICLEEKKRVKQNMTPTFR
ncbi:hypothetical protein GGR02_000175 [Anoxybacillus voinovskiensis]|uniref:Uncharacterized protein n=1 Tax=Anoxybacteroides voinovskiense TaxID=230470 RepID=A0A840DSA9_9BACL|nr:hypothetical protein [Anoxybacillus voinovskiensis]GGJ57944.1 hypothetical protein GCM10008982_03830 [Anoxybacillus voinovskiensis]